MIACAQSNAPLTGGPKDTTAPRIDSAKTNPLNGALNFSGTEMVLAFDEYITLNKPIDNIIITPQPNTPPIYRSKNKKVFIEFKEDLLENTTYTLNINGAIQDFTEKNDSVFQYVFSTGDFIDSLSLHGHIVNGFTNLPSEGLLVGLYPPKDTISYDSIIYKTKPTYIAQTDASGHFNFNYLKGGSYDIFAINDKNRNLIADENEEIAFLPSGRVYAGDSVEIDMKSFLTADNECELKEVYFNYPGSITFSGSCPLENFKVRSDIDLVPEDSGSEDSLIFWLAKSPTSGMKFILDNNGEVDTLKPFYEGVPDKIEMGKMQLTNNLNKGMLLPGENLKITASEPINPIEGAYYFLDVDSNEVVIEYEIIEPRTITFKTLNTTASIFHLDSGAVKSYYGNYSDADINLSFENNDSSYFGNLKVNTVITQSVIVQLMNSSKEIITQVPYANTLYFNDLIPGDYSLVLIIDENNDGEWTTGSISEKREPEQQIYSVKPMTVKSKWDKEIDWYLKANPVEE